MHKALNPRDNIDRLYVSRKEGRRRLNNIEEGMDVSIRVIEDNIKRAKRLITATRKNMQHIEQQNNNSWKTEMGSKRKCRYSKRQPNEILYEKTCTWVIKGTLIEKLNLF